jgi:hypothetical protein
MSADTEKKISFLTTQILKLVGGLLMMMLSALSYLGITVFQDVRASVTRIEINFQDIKKDVESIKVSFGRMDEKVNRNEQDIRELKAK